VFVSWDKRFEQLKEYKGQNGHCNVPPRDKSYPQLATWVQSQRRVYNKTKRGKLSPERINLLQGIGFKWVLGQGCRTDTVVVSDVEEEDSSSSEEEEEEDEDGTSTLKSTTGTQRRSPRFSKSTKLSRGSKTYKLRSSKSKEGKEEEAEVDSTLDNNGEVEDSRDFGGGGDSLDFNDNDGGNIPFDLDVNNESEVLSKEIKQLKEDIKVLTKKYDERGRTIEQQKRKDELLEEVYKMVDILEKQKKNLIEREKLVLRQFGDAKAEVSTLQSRILELEEELEAARAKTPKTRSQKRKCSASPESINSPRKKASVLESIAGPDTVEVRV